MCPNLKPTKKFKSLPDLVTKLLIAELEPMVSGPKRKPIPTLVLLSWSYDIGK